MNPRPHQIEALNAINQYNEGIINLPTGSGKTNIEAWTIVNNINNAWNWINEEDIPVFTILTPRILLTNQIYNEVKKLILEEGIDCQYLIVHSGRTEDRNFRNWTLDLPYRELKSTTSTREIISEYERAKKERVPLIILGTYDSSERIVNAEIPIYMLLCDEAHYLVSEEFGWIPKEGGEEYFPAFRKYYFTATLKETASNVGLGMNNSNLFGPIIYKKTPLQLINSGDILRPRLHLVDIETSKNDDDVDLMNKELDYDVSSIIDSFKEHRMHCNIGAKMLIVTKGSEHLNNITTHRRMKRMLETNPNLTIFDISSVHNPRINGEVVKREIFLSRLQRMSDTDQAIIFHINILTEGIDVPGITGVMIMNNMKLVKFLQTLGRATRLYSTDRERIYSGEIQPNELDRFVKPYAWIILPIYNRVIGEDQRENIQEIVYALREFGFNASEDVVIKQKRGSAIPKPLGGVNKKDTRAPALFDLFAEVEHIIEEREKADRLKLYYSSYENAKKEIKGKIKSQYEYESLLIRNNLPKGFPPQPHIYYKNWISWEDFLNININEKRQIYEFIRDNNLLDPIILSEFRKNKLLPDNFPTNVRSFFNKFQS